jgi:hypothetical protein
LLRCFGIIPEPRGFYFPVQALQADFFGFNVKETSSTVARVATGFYNYRVNTWLYNFIVQ